MAAVTVPDALSDTLAAAAGPVELRAADGRVLGDFVPRAAGPAPVADTPAGSGKRPPNLGLLAALAAIEARRANGPQFSTPINDQDLRDARNGEMYDLPG